MSTPISEGKKTGKHLLPCGACRETPSGFSASFLQSAARIICSPVANKFHTCSLRSIFCQVHAPAENVLDLIFCLRRKLCEAFLTV